MTIRTRFAPSPTGEIHVGNLRTMIFNWIFARQNGGKLFLRVEDTHETRSEKKYEDLMLEMIKWLELDYDNCFDDVLLKHGIHRKSSELSQDFLRQSDYINIYKNYAMDLYNQNMAYYCICENIEIRCVKCRKERHSSGVLRFLVPENIHISHNDLVFGEQYCNSDHVEDFALLRSNGSPTYMLCVVIDDFLMAITHIIRGEDHRTNTFKQILLYMAFGWKIPVFGHLPMVKDETGKKMSKRHGDANSAIYKNEGIIPQALFNILLKLGWGYKNEEIISKERILEIFQWNQVRKSATMFDKKKLYNFSGQYLRKFDYRGDLIEYIKKYKHNLDEKNEKIIGELYGELAKRSYSFNGCYEYVKFLFTWNFQENLCNEKAIEILNNVEDWTIENLKNILKTIEDQRSLRLQLVNSEYSLDLATIMFYLGKNEVFRRLNGK